MWLVLLVGGKLAEDVSHVAFVVDEGEGVVDVLELVSAEVEVAAVSRYVAFVAFVAFGAGVDVMTADVGAVGATVLELVGTAVLLLAAVVAAVELLVSAGEVVVARAVEVVARAVERVLVLVSSAVEVDEVAGARELELELVAPIVEVVWTSVELEVATGVVVDGPGVHSLTKGAVVHMQAGHVAHRHVVVAVIAAVVLEVVVGFARAVDEEDVGAGVDLGAGELESGVGHSLKHRAQSCES